MIDFYSGKAPPGSSIPVAMHLDVRPALDSFDVSGQKEAKRNCVKTLQAVLKTKQNKKVPWPQKHFFGIAVFAFLLRGFKKKTVALKKRFRGQAEKYRGNISSCTQCCDFIAVHMGVL